MTDKILSSIYTFSKKFSDPVTNLSFEQKNNNISAIFRNGNVNISLNIVGSDTEKYANITRLLKKNIECNVGSCSEIYLDEHFLEQYFTLSQFNLHFFLQTNGLLQIGQILEGKFCFFILTGFYFLKIEKMLQIHINSEKEKK